MVEICVMGSLNMDVVTHIPYFPQEGETLEGSSIEEYAGGKGANQAVAAARLGRSVAMIGAVGADAYGERLVEGLAQNGIDHTEVERLRNVRTGQTAILLTERGDNTILYVPGANVEKSTSSVERAVRHFDGAQILLVQLETPEENVLRAMEVAKALGMYVILDPAPVARLTESLLHAADCIVPNEVETEQVVGFSVRDEETARRAMQVLKQYDIERAIFKRGSESLFVCEGEPITEVQPIRVAAVDTIGAGDCFAGAFATALVEELSFVEAARFANTVAALKVTKRGVQEGMPTREEVEQFQERREIL